VLDLDTTVLIGFVVVITIKVLMVVGQIPFVEDLNDVVSPAHFNKKTS